MNFSGTLRVNKFACFTLAFFIFIIIYWRTANSSYLTDQNDLVNLKNLLRASVYAAELGGKRVIDGKSHALNMKSKGKTLEGANDPVTDADYASHCAMYYTLKNTFPKLAIVSEEHSTSDSSCEQQPALDMDNYVPSQQNLDMEDLLDEFVYSKDVTIWIDPLDATQEYTEAMYEYVTTMACVAIRGIPIIGVIHYPFPPRTYWGWFTKKTSSNLPHVEYKPEYKEHARVVVSRSHPGKVAELAKAAYGPQTVVTPAAGAGYKVMGVANGTFDVYLHSTAIKKWDICAGDAIIKTVNGQLTTLQGSPVNYSPDENVKVTGGILVTRFDHDFYLSKLPKEINP